MCIRDRYWDTCLFLFWPWFSALSINPKKSFFQGTESSRYETASVSSTIGMSGYDGDNFTDAPEDIASETTENEELSTGLGRGKQFRVPHNPGFRRNDSNISKLRNAMIDKQRTNRERSAKGNCQMWISCKKNIQLELAIKSCYHEKKFQNSW